jgi:hypothetical protein
MNNSSRRRVTQLAAKLDDAIEFKSPDDNDDKSKAHIIAALLAAGGVGATVAAARNPKVRNALRRRKHAAFKQFVDKWSADVRAANAGHVARAKRAGAQ